MKATTIILAAVLTFSINVLFASNDGASVNKDMNSTYISLAPITPAEATFDEMTEFNMVSLAPVTPTEADFSDAEIQPVNTVNLAPATPAFADFETI